MCINKIIKVLAIVLFCSIFSFVLFSQMTYADCNNNISDSNETGVDCGGVCITSDEEICNNIDDNHDCFKDMDNMSIPLTEICGQDNCMGNQTCSLGVWSDCDSAGNDCGVCSSCDIDGTCSVYDDLQDIDCNANDLPLIETCENNPDDNIYTWDYADSFDSVCEGMGVCTLGTYSYTHTCSISQCSAGCEINNTCTCPASSCIDADSDSYFDDYATYPAYGLCTNCSCDINEVEGSPCQPDITYDDYINCECEPEWTEIDWLNCTIDDYQYMDYYDSNNCSSGNPPEVNQSCNFCDPTWEVVLGTCQPDDTNTTSYDYTNTCCADTGLPSDCNKPLDIIDSCDYCTPVWSCSGYEECKPKDKNVDCNSADDSNNCYSQTELPEDDYTGDFSEFEQKDCECDPEWTLNSTWSDCEITDLQYQNYYDVNNCSGGIPQESENRSCNYCTSTWEQVNGTCQADDTNTTIYDYTNTCCADTGLTSDCNKPSDIIESCDFCEPDWICGDYGVCMPDNRSNCNSAEDLNNCFAQTGLPEDAYVGDLSEFEQEICEYIPPGNCSNGIAEWDEECDTNDFKEKTCKTEGFDRGSLSCKANCEISTSDCSNRRSGGGGGGSSSRTTTTTTVICTTSWDCSDWGECKPWGFMTRDCVDKSNCTNINSFPITTKSCDFELSEESESVEELTGIENISQTNLLNNTNQENNTIEGGMDSITGMATGTEYTYVHWTNFFIGLGILFVIALSYVVYKIFFSREDLDEE